MNVPSSNPSALIDQWADHPADPRHRCHDCGVGTRRDETLRERRLVARTAAAEGEQECGRVLICRRRVVDDAHVGVLEDDVVGRRAVNWERHQRNEFEVPQRVGEQIVQAGDRETDHGNLGQPQLLLEVDTHEVDSGRAAVDVDAGDNSQCAQCAAITEQDVNVDDVGCRGGQAGRLVERHRHLESRAPGEVDVEAAQDLVQQESIGVEEDAEQTFIGVFSPFPNQVVCVSLVARHRLFTSPLVCR